jgi:hypothetical protein
MGIIGNLRVSDFSFEESIFGEIGLNRGFRGPLATTLARFF